MNKKQIVFVTGGAGYIGSHTIIELIKKTDFEIISIDNFSNSSQKTFERIKKITGKEIKNYNVDLCSYDKTREIFKKYSHISGIIHFAALKSVPDSVENPVLYYENNIYSLLNILKCLKDFNILNFIFSSSCSVYGNINNLPVKETTQLNKAESPYGYTKQIGERIIEDFSFVHPGIKCISLRYFNPVGAHESGLIGEAPPKRPNNLIPVITQTAVGKIEKTTVFGGDYPTRDGTCIRDYIHVTDIANAHLMALDFLMKQKNSANYSVYNLGSGEGVSVLEAIQSFERISEKKLKYEIGPKREGDVMAIYSDCSAAKNELNWEAEFTLDQMMETAWKWQLNLEKGI